MAFVFISYVKFYIKLTTVDRKPGFSANTGTSQNKKPGGNLCRTELPHFTKLLWAQWHNLPGFNVKCRKNINLNLYMNTEAFLSSSNVFCYSHVVLCLRWSIGLWEMHRENYRYTLATVWKSSLESKENKLYIVWPNIETFN